MILVLPLRKFLLLLAVASERSIQMTVLRPRRHALQSSKKLKKLRRPRMTRRKRTLKKKLNLLTLLLSRRLRGTISLNRVL
jgi:hypothetical protein